MTDKSLFNVEDNKELSSLYEKSFAKLNALYEKNFENLRKTYQAKLDQIVRQQDTIKDLEKKFAKLTESIRAFAEMESMSAKEHVDVLEMIVHRLEMIESKVGQTSVATKEQTNDKNIETEKYTQNPNKSGESSLDQPSLDQDQPLLQSSIDRKEFFSILKYLADNKKSGKGSIKLEAKEINIFFWEGRVSLFSAPLDKEDSNWKEMDKNVDKFRVANLERENEENLVQMLAETMQKKTQYLSGITRVLQKMPKRQLIVRLKNQQPPSLKKEKETYNGITVFYYLVWHWPQQGEEKLAFHFVEKEAAKKEPEGVITVAALLNKAHSFLKEVEG